MADVATLCPDEVILLDPGRLRALVEQVGEDAAEQLVDRTMDDLAARLCDLDALWRGGRLEDIGRRAQGLAGIAEPMGLSSLALVARDVAACAAGGDAVAVAATLARLRRIGDRSLDVIWGRQNLSL